MKFEHWQSDNCDSLVLADNVQYLLKNGMLGDNPVFVCTIEAESYEEAMKKYYKMMGWGEYKPMEFN